MNEKQLFAFTDESGNSGLNLFDPKQPFFFTGTMLVEENLEVIAKDFHASWLDLLKVPELHANQLGLGKIEKIAHGIFKILNTCHIRFIFTVIEKSHVSTMKLVNTLMDSGLNMAVSNVHYGARALRLPLALLIANHTSDEVRKLFWDAYEKQDIDAFRKILSRLIWNIRTKENGDARAKELVLDALEWGVKNPEKLLNSKRGDLNSPNVIALSPLIQAIHDELGHAHFKVREFVHDEQNQFAKGIFTIYEVLSKISTPTTPLSWLSDVNSVDTFKCNLKMVPSRDSVGLQILDICLWLWKRSLTSPIHAPDSKKLATFIVENSHAEEFSYSQLVAEVRRGFWEVGRIPLKATEIEKGKTLSGEIEKARKERMKT